MVQRRGEVMAHVRPRSSATVVTRIVLVAVLAATCLLGVVVGSVLAAEEDREVQPFAAEAENLSSSWEAAIFEDELPSFYESVAFLQESEEMSAMVDDDPALIESEGDLEAENGEDEESSSILEASNACTAKKGVCKSTKLKCSAGAFYANLCSGGPTTKCCIQYASTSTVGVGAKCGFGSSRTGTCKKTATGCPGSFFQKLLCPGPMNVQCCLPKGTKKPAAGASTKKPAAKKPSSGSTAAAGAAGTSAAPSAGAGKCAKAAKMAALAAARAGPFSKGKCAKFVGDYIQGAGIAYTRTNAAKDTGPQLIRAGFRLLPQGAASLPGDVRVIMPVSGHPFGHMQMHVGKTGIMWASDFKQRDQWPGPQWRNNAKNVKYNTYRYNC